jgi:hypothetical protein
MKKLCTILTVVALTTTISFSQVEVDQGSFLLEIGNNSFHAQSVNSIDGMGSQDFGDIYDKYNINEFNLGLGAGYFVIDGLAIGLGIQYASSSTVVKYADEDIFGDDYESSENELIISPLVRYYFGESGVWTSFDYAIATISMDDSDGSYDDAEFPKRSAMNLKVGYAISLNDYVSLNPMIGYNLTTQTTKDAGYDQDGNDADHVVKSGALGIGVSLTVHLGY